MAILLGPVLLATGVLWLAAPFLADLPLPVRLAALGLLSCAVGVLSQRGLRRLMPLASLLRMTMVFPDKAPSRFRVARMTGHPRVLKERLSSLDRTEALAADVVLSLVAALSLHDRHTRGHSERVRAYTDLLSSELGLTEHARDRLRWAALLHDIGKLRIAPSLLGKPSAPNAQEWQQLRAHPKAGEQIAQSLLPWLGEWGAGIAEHHERYDGRGYPLGLSAETISRAGRIIAVVDSFETMTAVRPYKKAMSHRMAREELARCAGEQFDPVLVRAFLGISVPKVVWAMGPLSALLQLPYVATIQFAGTRVIEASAGAAAAAVVTAPLLIAGVAPTLVVGASAAPAGHPAPSSSATGTTRSQAQSDPTASRSGGPTQGAKAAPALKAPTRKGSTPKAATPHAPTPKAATPKAPTEPKSGPSATPGPAGSPAQTPTPTPSGPSRKKGLAPLLPGPSAATLPPTPAPLTVTPSLSALPRLLP